MGKRESFLLVLIAAFFMLLLYTVFFSVQKPRVYPDPIRVNLDLIGVNREVEIVLGGDVMLGRSVLTESESVGDWRYPFLKVADRLKEADLVFINLESPFMDGCPRTNTGMKFCSDPRMVEGLVWAGIDVVSLANNHFSDYGESGIATTKKVLAGAKIESVGRGNLLIKEVNGTKFGFLGFNFVFRGPSEAELELIRDSDQKVAVLVVGVHWGEEYKASPTNKQKLIAKNLVEAGADVVVGHHPHWLQGEEYINGKPVYYSLGNFVFDQMWSEETKKGLVMKLTFKDGKLQKEEKLPVYISALGQPEFESKEQ